MDASSWIAIGGLVFTILMLLMNFVAQLRGGVFDTVNRERRLHETLVQSIDRLRSETTHNMASINQDLLEGISQVRKEAEESNAIARSQFGEALSALRQKMHDDVLHAERTFLRRDEYHRAADADRAAMQQMDKKMDSRFDRIEQRLDRLSAPTASAA